MYNKPEDLLSENSLPLKAFRAGEIYMALQILTQGTEMNSGDALILLHESSMALTSPEKTEEGQK